VIAEYATSHWLQNIRANPEVKVRVQGKEFSARARVLSAENDADLNRQVQQLSHDKYGWGEGLVVEIIPR
jgi:deazaflavin-dependent oxidoreductase (nitroreductase family)